MRAAKEEEEARKRDEMEDGSAVESPGGTKRPKRKGGAKRRGKKRDADGGVVSDGHLSEGEGYGSDKLGTEDERRAASASAGRKRKKRRLEQRAAAGGSKKGKFKSQEMIMDSDEEIAMDDVVDGPTPEPFTSEGLEESEADVRPVAKKQKSKRVIDDDDEDEDDGTAAKENGVSGDVPMEGSDED